MTARLSNGSIYLLAVGIVYTTKKQKKKLKEKKPTPRAYNSQEKWLADPSSVGEKDVLRDATRQKTILPRLFIILSLLLYY